ncbi:MAG TPA: rod shape-determining protein MreD [Acidobacteria bacterium]|nr:rod shape-determining protein MreD [Acidobacteriota bacterium]
MNVLKFLAVVALAVLVHVLGVRMLPQFALIVDVFLVVVVLYGLEASSLTALGAGLCLGLVHDSLTGAGFGLFGFADTLIGYGAARLAQRLVIQRPTGVLALVSFAVVAQQALVVALTFLLLPWPEVPSPLWVALRAGASGLLGMLIHVGSTHWRRTAEARRRSRLSRLRLG